MMAPRRVVSRLGLLALLAASSGCTTLGPMPATTGVAWAPAARPDVTLGLAAVPGYYLSSAVQRDAKGASVQQATVLVEPDRWVSAPGIALGARYVGKGEQGGYLEPMLAYRTHLDESARWSAGGALYGTHGKGESKRASYDAWRGGAELGADLRVTPDSHWLELHLLASASLTALSAQGEYCLDAQGRYGVDCGDPPAPLSSASVKGFYPAVTGVLAFETGRHLESIFHGLRLELEGSAGTQPTVVAAEQDSARPFVAIGGGLSLGLGATK
ncbi:MAG TPA: hypothetical protein VGP93_20625 [Polyangiaceae bacterium]|nr:hypothetical protein [Polyangiaceae bacterium]